MGTKKLYKVLLVTVAPLAFAASVHADCTYDNLTSAWICDPLQPFTVSGSGSTSGGTGTGYPPGSWGGGSGTTAGYSGVDQIIQYVRNHRQYCRTSTQSCAIWGSLAARTTAQGGYDLCVAFASRGSIGWNACMDQLEMTALGLDTQAYLCSQVAC